MGGHKWYHNRIQGKYLSLKDIVDVAVFHWPPVRAVLPNYEVVDFQPQLVNAPYLAYIAYCYASIPFPLFAPLPVQLPTDGESVSCPI